jgi:hypothetical protein
MLSSLSGRLAEHDGAGGAGRTVDAAVWPRYAAIAPDIIQSNMHYAEITLFQTVIVFSMLGILVPALVAIVITLWRLPR